MSCCAPHDWMVPLAHSKGLECAVCDRVMLWDDIPETHWYAIRKAYRRRHSEPHADRFEVACELAKVMEPSIPEGIIKTMERRSGTRKPAND